MRSLRSINFFRKFINDVGICRKLKQIKKQTKKRECVEIMANAGPGKLLSHFVHRDFGSSRWQVFLEKVVSEF